MGGQAGRRGGGGELFDLGQDSTCSGVVTGSHVRHGEMEDVHADPLRPADTIGDCGEPGGEQVDGGVVPAEVAVGEAALQP